MKLENAGILRSISMYRLCGGREVQRSRSRSIQRVMEDVGSMILWKAKSIEIF